MDDPANLIRMEEDEELPRDLRDFYLPTLFSDLKKLKLALQTRRKIKIKLKALAKIWVGKVQKSMSLNLSKAEQTIRFYCSSENAIFRLFRTSGNKQEFIKLKG